MARNNTRTRRIFGGNLPQPAGYYDRPLNNPAGQAISETLAVGTYQRVFPGPALGHAAWSYHINPTSAAGATSALKFYYSNLSNPDPTDATHWVDSGVASISLSVLTDAFGTVTTHYPTWIKAEAVIVTSSGALWAFVRSGSVEE